MDDRRELQQFGEALKRIRYDELHISQEGLARRIRRHTHCERRLISYIERGEVPTSSRICRALRLVLGDKVDKIPRFPKENQ